MTSYTWSDEKDDVVRTDPGRRGVGFDECVKAIEAGRILGIFPNPSRNHQGQQMFVLDIDDYAYCVPFVETETRVFLKTVYPSRRFTALYLRRRQ